MKKKRNPSKHVFILANKTTSSTLFYLFFVFNEKNRAHIDIYYNFYNTFATSKQAKNKGIMKPIYSRLDMQDAGFDIMQHYAGIPIHRMRT